MSYKVQQCTVASMWSKGTVQYSLGYWAGTFLSLRHRYYFTRKEEESNIFLSFSGSSENLKSIINRKVMQEHKIQKLYKHFISCEIFFKKCWLKFNF